MKRLRLGRHFALLTVAAAALWATREARVATGLDESFAAYGALHALTLVAALRAPPAGAPGPPARWRALGFVALAALLSLLAALLGAALAGRLGSLPGRSGARTALALASFCGALCYLMLIRRLWVPDLSVFACLAVAAGCATVTLSLSLFGMAAVGGQGMYFAVAWWFALSAGLCGAMGAVAGVGAKAP